ncbi:coiled-coil and C2 domain-containing protein 2A-like isoform X3 [Ptychodera flava]|uniref:coiled-coil and C2 domain-containing protein 2A-like isoform X3 n=1 Tax=Ptychodera flava TaxID=63121 RepID=UPI00396A0318
MSGQSTLAAKIRERRKKLRESLADTSRETEGSDMELTPRTNGFPESGMHGDDDETALSSSREAYDDLIEAQKLIDDLEERRAETKKELEQSLKESDKPKPSKRTKLKPITPKAEETPKIEDEATKDEKPKKKKKARIKKEPKDETEEAKEEEAEPTEKPEEDKKLMSAEEAVLAVAAGTAGSSSPAPANLNQSIRDRLRKKMSQMKEKAEEEKKEDDEKEPGKVVTGKPPPRRLRGMRGRQLATRFDEPMSDDEKKLHESIAAKTMWQKARKALKKKESAMPSEEEAFDFFVKVFDKEPDLPSVPPTGEPEAGPSEEREESAKEKEKKEEKEKDEEEKPVEDAKEDEPLLSDYFVDLEEWKTQPYSVNRAQYTPYQKVVDREAKVYFRPSVASVPENDKIPEERQPRYLEDEGFYVGVRPPVERRNVNIEENRLLMREDKGRKWFGDDGRIIALPDPLKDQPTRPPVIEPEDIDVFLQTDYKKAYVVDFDSRFIDGLGETYGSYQIDVDINSIIFSHHSLFSKEHVLAAKLQQLYSQYLMRSQKDATTFLTDKLRALKEAVAHLKKQMDAQMKDLNSSFAQDQMTRYQDYKYEIRQTRKSRDTEMHYDRQLLKNILKAWKEIKALRESQGCINTAVKLSVRKEETDKDEDMTQWKRDIDEEISEAREEYEETFNENMSRYNLAKAEYDRQKKIKDAIKKRKKRRRPKRQGSRENLTDRTSDTGGESQTEDDEDAIPEPQKPAYEFNEQEAREKIKSKAQQIMRKPGEPKLYPELTNAAVITPTHNCPKAEQSRRRDQQKCQCYVRILFNNKEVSRTSVKTLTSDFTVHFGDIFNIQIVQWPESIRLEVYENGSFSDTMLAEVYAAIPEPQVTTSNVQIEELDFSSDQKVSYGHEGVGSGYTFKIGDENLAQEYTLLTSGCLLASVAWGVGDDGTVLVPPISQTAGTALGSVKQFDALSAIGATGMVDTEKLAKWISESRLDPNDPANAALLHLIKHVSGDDKKMPVYFRLEQLQQEFNFVTDEELEKSKRFKLIELREKEIPEFRNYSLIPIREKDVTDDIFEEYEKKKKAERDLQVGDDKDPHRAAVAKFLSKVREQVMTRFRAAQHQFTLQDVIAEEPVPNITLLSANLLKLAEPRRPLKPVRKERKVVTAQSLGQTEVKILVNIERAFDVPVRKEALTLTELEAALITPGKVTVRPFVECVFQRHTKQTSVAEGPNPNWSEELSLPFKPPNNDYSSASLQTCKDLVYLNLFDEVVVDMLEDDRARATNIHQRLERKWLGSLKIPFSTVYFQGQIEGNFRLQAPRVLLGYQRAGPMENTTTQYGQGKRDTDNTYLQLFITIEPALSTPEPVKEKFDTTEDEKLLNFAENYQMQFEKKHPKRDILTTVMDINGKSVFVTRYFKALKPPAELLSAESNPLKQAELIARFVSLIPFVSDSVVFPGMCDIWSTCDQFLQMLQGDEEEHAVLLCNYFLHLGKKAWLLIGSAIPEGSTTYVLTREADNNFLIWNPSTGEHYPQYDNFCRLKSVGCLINQENIWANIQLNEEPYRIDFDVTKSNMWRPLFTKTFSNPNLTSVQVDELRYYQTDKGYVSDLTDKIEKKLREKLMEWRPRHITRFNRYCTQVFRNLLRKLEENRGNAAIMEHKSELEQVMGSYTMSGFPLNLTYTEMAPIVDAVYSTGVHVNESTDVEFALAVHIHPYPNNILSVWVYIAAVSRKR